MPADGIMKWMTVDTDLGGEPAGSRTIHISYYFPAGKAGGKSYESISRTAYIPATN